jgi:hypothetical protein
MTMQLAKMLVRILELVLPAFTLYHETLSAHDR